MTTGKLVAVDKEGEMRRLEDLATRTWEEENGARAMMEREGAQVPQ